MVKNEDFCKKLKVVVDMIDELEEEVMILLKSKLEIEKKFKVSLKVVEEVDKKLVVML